MYKILFSLLLLCSCITSPKTTTVNSPESPNYEESVLIIYTDFALGSAGGTGTIIKVEEDRFYFITACHILNPHNLVVGKFFESKVIREGFSEFISAEVLAFDVGADIALLSAPNPILIEIDDLEINLGLGSIPPMTEVAAIGYPFHLGLTPSIGLMGSSIYIPFVAEDLVVKQYIFTAPVAPGYSGGPVVDRSNGNLLGMILGYKGSHMTHYPNIAVMISTETIVDWLYLKGFAHLL